ncbi:KTSC domain-containing protein [Pedobacter sp.]|uniref:KTSC domain-containing protein n=1 Tax=Pedobacter sp. TaxID=1411316 RepID=UPI003D7FFBAA
MPSSVVAAITYFPETSVLRVVFVSGNVYDYKKVPETEYLNMKSARSKGKYLNERIKRNYSFEQVK